MNIAILSRSQNIFSTNRLVEAAQKNGHNVRVVDHTKCFLEMQKGGPAVFYKGESLDDIDAVIPRIGASVTFYGTAVVRQFEMMNTFAAVDSQSIYRSRDKLRSLQILARSDVGIPKTAFAKKPRGQEVKDLIKHVGGAPVIVKLLEGTQGLGVVLAETENAAKSVIEAFSGLNQNILIQEFIKEAGGADIRAFVVDGQVIGAMKRQGETGEFRSNLHRGGKGSTIKLTKKEQSVAVKAAKAMGLAVAGVDLLKSSKGPMVVEVNSSPGLEGIEKATNIDIADKIIKYIEKDSKKKSHARTKIQG